MQSFGEFCQLVSTTLTVKYWDDYGIADPFSEIAKETKLLDILYENFKNDISIEKTAKEINDTLANLMEENWEKDLESDLKQIKLLQEYKTPEEFKNAGILLTIEEFLNRPHQDLPTYVMLDISVARYLELIKTPSAWLIKGDEFKLSL